MNKIIVTLFLFFQLVFTLMPAHASQPESSFTIGSKTFTESVILGEVIAQIAASKAAVKTEHKAQLGGTNILWNALLNGEIDAYPEYTGTLMRGILSKNNIQTLAELRLFLKKKGIHMTKALGFNNTYALGVTIETARKFNLSQISDLSNYPELIFGFNNEFMDRADGWPGLQKHYRLPQPNVTGLDHDLAYRALESNSIHVWDLYSTDAEIDYYNLVVLEDDKHYFPDYLAVILYREELQINHPKIAAALHQLSGKIDATTMISMNADVKLNKKSEAIVASTFLEENMQIESNVVIETEWQRFIRYSKEHIILVLISLIAAIIVSIPLGILAAKRSKFTHVILGTASIIQTIPALALFVFMIPLLGIGGPPAVVALFLYSLLPIIRNTYAGLNDIPNEIIESAQVLGLSELAQLRIVEIPLATRSILAGIKTSAVINVGTATLGAIIGAGGYGQPILTGIRLDDTNLILQGAIPAAILALMVQGVFGIFERRMLPKTSQHSE